MLSMLQRGQCVHCTDLVQRMLTNAHGSLRVCRLYRRNDPYTCLHDAAFYPDARLALGPLSTTASPSFASAFQALLDHGYLRGHYHRICHP